jgi:hypothetical protein
MTLTGNPRIALSGAGYALTSDAAATVGPGATTSFRITFSPSTAGTYSGSAGIASNDPDKSAFTFALTGTGVQEMQDPPVMTVQPMATPERLALP